MFDRCIFICRSATNDGRLIQSATETSEGIAEIATQAEADAGLDDERIITSKKMRFGFDILKAATGHIIFPSWMGGFIYILLSIG